MEVFDGPLKDLWPIIGTPKQDVAFDVNKTSDAAHLMTVIDHDATTPKWLSADGAVMTLSFKERCVIRHRYAVSGLQLCRTRPPILFVTEGVLAAVLGVTTHPLGMVRLYFMGIDALPLPILRTSSVAVRLSVLLEISRSHDRVGV